MTRCYLSFDVEDWFHAHNLRPGLDWEKWDEYELRVVDNTRKILDLLDEHETKATFFILGHVAERAPELVKEIDDRSHEVASHGYNHELLYEQTRDEVRRDVKRSVELLESITGSQVKGYRAPSFTITEWALDVLEEIGLEYDSSNFPIKGHDRYGGISVNSNETITTSTNGLIEVQLPLFRLGSIGIPWAGGGYFRFIPYKLFKTGIQRILRRQDFVFYLHPWELDTSQPKVSDIPKSYRIRHYWNLGETERRLTGLLKEFDWHPIQDGLRTNKI